MRRCLYKVRLAERRDLHFLPKIELAASKRYFPFGVGDSVINMTFPLELLEQRQYEGQLWVAADRRDRPVGFATSSVLDGIGHLDELSVLPKHGRQGLGGELVSRVCDWARFTSMHSVTLSTFEEIPWNVPFYQRLRFRIMRFEELTRGLLILRDAERRAGLPVDRRVFMKREV